MLKRLILSILLAWLPLQGIAAYTMPFCRHALHAPSAEAAHQHADHEDHAHHGHGGIDQPPPDRAGDWLGCNDCGACELACAAAILPAPAPRTAAPVRGEPDAAPSLAPPAHVPDLPNPPPLPRA